MHLSLVSLVVPSYDQAIDFFVNSLGFTLTSDVPAITNEGHPKRWVVVHPPSTSSSSSKSPATAGILLAEPSRPEQATAIGSQFAGRVGLFLSVDQGQFEAQYRRMKNAGVEFVGEPREESYGKVVVFKDCVGNKWDLLEGINGVER